MAEEFLVAQALHKSFNEHKVVNGVSFTIDKCEIFGLLGPNGAGKTTNIRTLSTVLEPDRGDVTVGGHSIRHHADAVRSLIGVCQRSSSRTCWPALTGRAKWCWLAPTSRTSRTLRNSRSQRSLTKTPCGISCALTIRTSRTVN